MRKILRSVRNQLWSHIYCGISVSNNESNMEHLILKLLFSSDSTLAQLVSLLYSMHTLFNRCVKRQQICELCVNLPKYDALTNIIIYVIRSDKTGLIALFCISRNTDLKY